ncbi:GNAT family N-acetyltransferase [Ideonella sp. A 288]|uniref:GNAT family N-acetyltransferase n=1 Tax=Ideonella sp. A 288 TaxID=1962181 RepID=UPI000B4B760B|nr:GNAT family N-acetyltransferase [Ideonella sp. A 288]
MLSTPLTAPGRLPDAVRLRAHGPGDIGWIISRHGALYAREYGWDLRFEALVARIAADFIDRFDATREACWIAERTGTDGVPERLGCVVLVQARDDATGAIDPGVAQLRLLLVEPAARGLGVGRRLVAECTRFARDAGQTSLRLWTQSNLVAARAIYQREGYRLVGTEPHHSFGHALVGEIWDMPLVPAAAVGPVDRSTGAPAPQATRRPDDR